MKRISTEAYQALRDALPAIIWNKRPFETFLRTALRDHPEILSGLNFGDTKRAIADALIDRLVKYETKYQPVALQLMLEIGSMTRFPNLEQLKDPKDRSLRLSEAKNAVDHLHKVTEQYAADLAANEMEEAARKASAVEAAAMRRFSDDLDALRIRFLDLQSETNPHARGVTR